MLAELETRAEVSADTEAQLWDSFLTRREDEALAGQLVDLYLPLAVKVVRRLDMQILSRAEPRDLIGTAVQGLHQAVQRYDPASGVPFPCFAEIRIRGAILDELRQRDPLTRSQRQTIRRVQTAVAEFAARHARLPTPEEISAEVEVPAEQVSYFMNMAADPVNLEEEFEEGLRYQDIIPDDREPTPDAAADVVFGLEAMRVAIRQLSVREQQLLYLRHDQELGVRETAEALGVTPGRVSQMYGEILARLRVLMHINA